MMRVNFTKMHGLGNDFVVIDLVTQRFYLSPELIRRMADRHFGVGFDQLLVVEPPDQPDVDFRYRIFNADGSEVEQCGNGARCFGSHRLDFVERPGPGRSNACLGLGHAGLDTRQIGVHAAAVAILDQGHFQSSTQAATPSGSCMVRQCRLPFCSINGRHGTMTTSRSGNAACSTSKASRSVSTS